MPGTVNKTQSISHKAERTSGVKRIGWFVLVGLIPLIVVAIIIGVALQIVGVPVWQTTKDMVEGGPTNTVSSSLLQATQQDLEVETAKERVDSGTIDALRQQVAVGQQQIQTLNSQLTQLKNQLTAQKTSDSSSKEEAQVLSQMDPSAAASMLGNLSVAEGATVVAVMSPAESGPILAAMDPTQASQLLSAAAKLPGQR